MLTVTAAATSHNLCTVPVLREELGLATTEDKLLLRLIVDASAAIADYCNRTFAKQTYQETVPGFGDTNLLLTVTPVVSIASITRDGQAVADYTIEHPDAGLLYREAGWAWSPRLEPRGTISAIPLPRSEKPIYTVTYVAGYDLPDTILPTLPKAVERAAIEAVKDWYHGRAQPRRGPATAVRFSDGSAVEYARSDDASLGAALPGVSTRLLSPHIRRP